MGIEMEENEEEDDDEINEDEIVDDCGMAGSSRNLWDVLERKTIWGVPQRLSQDWVPHPKVTKCRILILWMLGQINKK